MTSLKCTGKETAVHEVYNTRFFLCSTRVITKLPNSEQSSKGKVKTHKYKCINR